MATPESITEYEALRELPDKSVVQDADGRVWCVQHHSRYKNERWLSPFSDEYSWCLKEDGSSYALGNTPTLPIVPLGVTCSQGG